MVHAPVLKKAQRPNSPEERRAEFAIIRRDLDQRTAVIAVEGELDLSTAPRLKTMLIDALEQGKNQLVADLALVTFIDSTTLAVLVGIHKRLDHRARLAIVCTDERVLKIVEFSGTDGLLATFQTLEQALTHVQGQAAQSA